MDTVLLKATECVLPYLRSVKNVLAPPMKSVCLRCRKGLAEVEEPVGIHAGRAPGGKRRGQWCPVRWRDQANPFRVQALVAET